MTRRDYELLASSLKSAYANASAQQKPGVLYVMGSMIGVFKHENSGFLPDKFLRACGHPEVASEIGKPVDPPATPSHVATDQTLPRRIRKVSQ